jgi:hypothetical protein
MDVRNSIGNTIGNSKAQDGHMHRERLLGAGEVAMWVLPCTAAVAKRDDWTYRLGHCPARVLSIVLPAGHHNVQVKECFKCSGHPPVQGAAALFAG